MISKHLRIYFQQIINSNGIVFLLMLSFLPLTSCKKLEQNIELEMPPFTPQLQVECYLQSHREPCDFNGTPIPQPYLQATLTETQDYFTSVDTPFVDSATVVVSYDGKTVVLENNNLPDICDTTALKLFNYKNYLDKIELKENTTYSLKITDKKGRTLTAQTQCLKVVDIDTIMQSYDERSNRSYLVAYFYDDASTNNYYRARWINLSENTRSKRLRDAILIDGSYNGLYFPFGGSVEYNEGDTIELTLFHITRDYYQYLRTLNQAESALGNPFGSPATIESNIQGGMGIFTCLPASKKRIILKK